ncbi:MAG TPA: cellulase family glycosylhydrolase [Acetobacteraceae bacterium]|nr:cellulase family glycosylhydrolase [Acetobacteraceae bacterium]
MPTIGYRLLVVLLALLLLAAAGEPPEALRRGINVTHWFRFPPSRDPAALRAYLGDAALDVLKQAGFTFVRIPVQPDLLAAPEALADAVARGQRHGLAAVVALFAAHWHLETDPADRAKLLATWRSLAPVLRRFDPAATFPEVLNEPVFASDPTAWARLQHQAVVAIRAALPSNTIVLSGANWGGIDGLLSLLPDSDPNVIYSFHLYEPAELTALGAYRAGLDEAAMARLPFPATDPTTCQATADTARDRPTADLMRFYCAQRWDQPKVARRIADAEAWAQRHHVAVLAGEFGASQQLNQPARVAWLTAVRQECERQGIGWALWGYDDSMGFALHPPSDRRRYDPAVLRALGLMRSSNREALRPRTTNDPAP